MIDLFVNFVDNYMKPMEDFRTQQWFLVPSIYPLLAILFSYNIFCNVIGPKLMRNQKPFDLKTTIFAYNIFQIAFSAYLFYEGLSCWLEQNSFFCVPVDRSQAPNALRLARFVWLYYMCKIIELVETVFFVMRKKNKQISFLHVYHHTMMALCSWIGIKYLPGGHCTLLGVINSFIHVIMYVYYLLSGLNESYRKFLWWKKYLTVLQLVQFGIVAVHNIQFFFINCNFPKFFVLLSTIQSFIFIFMFSKFYYNSYIVHKKNQ